MLNYTLNQRRDLEIEDVTKRLNFISFFFCTYITQWSIFLKILYLILFKKSKKSKKKKKKKNRKHFHDFIPQIFTDCPATLYRPLLWKTPIIRIGR